VRPNDHAQSVAGSIFIFSILLSLRSSQQVAQSAAPSSGIEPRDLTGSAPDAKIAFADRILRAT